MQNMLLEFVTKELKIFLSSLECIKNTSECGPVQYISETSRTRETGLTIIVPLPWEYSQELIHKIRDDTDKWAEKRKLESFGILIAGDSPLLLMGLRSI